MMKSHYTKIITLKNQLSWLLIAFTLFSLAGVAHASNTKSLKIPSDFRFETFKTTKLDLSVFDANGNALEGKLVRVFSISDNSESVDENSAAQRSSILIARTDAFGRIYTDMQITNSTKQLLLVVDAVGSQNESYVDFNGEEIISRQFKLDQTD